jgi:hypothetical protein
VNPSWLNLDDALNIDDREGERRSKRWRLQYIDYVDFKWRLTLTMVDVNRNAIER